MDGLAQLFITRSVEKGMSPLPIPVVKSVTPIHGSYEEQVARLCRLLHRHVKQASLGKKTIIFIYDIDDTVVTEDPRSHLDVPIVPMARCFRKYVRQFPSYYITARPRVPGNDAATRSMLHTLGLSGFRDLKLREPGARAGPYKWATCQEISALHGRNVYIVRAGDMLWDTVPFPYPSQVAQLAGPHRGHFITLSNGIALLLPTPGLY
jgi:hypothetical protein